MTTVIQAYRTFTDFCFSVYIAVVFSCCLFCSSLFLYVFITCILYFLLLCCLIWRKRMMIMMIKHCFRTVLIAVEVLYENAPYESTFYLLTYLLTYYILSLTLGY